MAFKKKLDELKVLYYTSTSKRLCLASWTGPRAEFPIQKSGAERKDQDTWVNFPGLVVFPLIVYFVSGGRRLRVFVCQVWGGRWMG